MFIDYVNSDKIHGVTKQHNIMVFVGNGFDIGVLKKYRKDKLITSYSKFYDYLSFKGESMDKNTLYNKMTVDKEKGKEDWSDFEVAIGELIENGIGIQILEDSLKEIQDYFLLFLNEMVEPQILLNESEDAQKNKWGINSISKFLGDLDEEDYNKMQFPKETDHYQMFNYLFINFNYTSLLDNYVFLDKEQFEPHPYKNVDTNFKFYPNPKRWGENPKISERVWSTFVETNVIHPHGYQNIPRSLLFGIEDERYRFDRDINKMNKSYWAQNNQKYSGYFENVDLFIIFGASIGTTDSWWWKRILALLINTDSELMIYYYKKKNYDKEYVKKKFLDACESDEDEAVIEKVKEKIFVVLYTDANDNILFNLQTEK